LVAPAPIPSLMLFRDLPLKIQLPPDLDRDVRAFADRPQTSLTPADWPAYVNVALALADRCIQYCDAEMARLTEQRYGMPDPNALKQRLVGDPRRQVEQILQQLKTKLANEKQEWARRVAKQMSDVATTLDQQIDSLVMEREEERHAIVLVPEKKWFRDFVRWKAAVFDKWAAHLPRLLQSKTTQLVQPELDAVRDLLGEQVVLTLPVPAVMPLPMGREQPKEFVERIELPTPLEMFFELFKGNLATVAMIAGMVIIPVVGELMNQAAVHIRAVIMGSMVVPIVLFAALQARGTRKKNLQQGEEKALDRMRKAVAAESKSELERFKPDAERYSAAYCNTAQAAILAVLEPTVARVFEQREQRAGADLARAHLSAERIQEAIGTLRQAKTAFTGQLVVDLRRRQIELAAAPPQVAAPAGAKA
jgi:hypothetical protein